MNRRASLFLLMLLFGSAGGAWAQGYNAGYGGGSGGSGTVGPAGPAGPAGPGPVMGNLTPNLKNSATGTTTNLLVRWTCSAQDIHSCAVRTIATTDTITTGVCDSTCDAVTTDTPIIATRGSHAVVFDNQTIVGDCAIISTTVAGDAHDSGAACSSHSNLSSPTTNLVGTVTTLNTGVGTTASVNLSISNHQIPLYTSGKCVVLANKQVGTCVGVSCSGGANGSNGWTNLCTVPLGPWPFDPGPTNTTCYITGTVVDFTFAPAAGSGGVGSLASATNLDFRLATAGGNSDPHGFPIGAGTQFNTTGTRYSNEVIVSLLNFATDPFYPAAQTLEVDAQTDGPTNSGVQVNAAVNDANSIPNGTAFLVTCTPFLS
jgi:hypothetical protein